MIMVAMYFLVKGKRPLKIKKGSYAYKYWMGKKACYAKEYFGSPLNLGVYCYETCQVSRG